jgi:hypothetical protein
MITSRKNKNQVYKDSISFDLLAEKMNEFLFDMNTSFEEIVNVETKKLKIKNTLKYNKRFSKEILEFQTVYKNHLKKAPLSFQTYLGSIHSRSNQLNEMLFKIKTYPIKSITNQLKKEAEEQGIENTKIKTFVNELTNSLVNLVVQYTFEFEEYLIDKLCEKEMDRIGVDYVAENEGLRRINSQKHEEYIKLLYKGIKAFYYDFKAFVNTESTFFNVIERFFLKLMNKIEALKDNCSETLESKNTTNAVKINIQEDKFPTHIFKDNGAFHFFEQLATHAKNQEEIGFYFRQMSEKENPKCIVAKETVFRNWFNEESGHKIELKNPIKTYDRIKGISQKHNFYSLIKDKSIKKTTNL